MSDAAVFDALLRGIHECPRGLTCRPGRGARYPVPPQGAPSNQGPDVLLVGWNPRGGDVAGTALPDLGSWRRDAAEALGRLARSGSDEAHNMGGALPAGVTLDGGRVMRTYLWKWPTRVKTGEGESAFYAQRCMRSHFDEELALLRPRVLVTFHAEAAEEMAGRARALGVEVRAPHSAVRSREALGWTLPSQAWGWPMGLVLLQDAAPRYEDGTLTWARMAAEHVLARTPSKT